MNDLFSIQGKVALVTGGGSGIGWMIAEAYARAGARVYIASRKKKELETRISELGDDGDCRAIVADLSSETGCSVMRSNSACTTTVCLFSVDWAR